jgi:glycosyltransferase involved in cell wall biosynthesis
VTAPRISLVIPAFNEARLLPRLLDSVAIARERFAARGGAVEVIVADNVSTDDTAQIAAARGCLVATVTTRAIAAVRNGGARAATGEILAFVDADSRIHPDSFIAVDEAMRSSRIVGGSTGCTLERWSVGLAVTFAVMLPMLWLTGIDTGVVFCRRADFERLGGYDESYRAAEDVMWLWKLKRDGASRRQRLVRLRHAKVVASTRKFDEHGDWHYFRFLVAAPQFFLRGRKLSASWDRYWYQPDR